MDDVTSALALLYAACSVGVIAFQLALALGAPWGELTMGGRFAGRLPMGLRVAAAAQALLLAMMALVVLVGAEMIQLDWPAAWMIWAVVVFCAVAVVLNLITPSRRERRLWAPVTLVMLSCSATVALTAA